MRNFADRDRGFRSTSASVATTGRLVNGVMPGVSSINRFTNLSSSEWKLITANRPPASNADTASGNASIRLSSSAFTAKRKA